MFESIAGRPRDAATTRRQLTIVLSVVGHTTIVGFIALLSLWYFTPVRPAPPEILAFVTAPPPSPPPPPPPPAPRVREPRPKPVTPAPVVPAQPVAAPVEAPRSITPEVAAETPVATIGVPGGIEGGVPAGIIGGVPDLPPPLPPPEPVRVGGQLKPPALIARVAPQYPPLAQSAHVQGMVILEATVDQTGHVDKVVVLRSGGILDQAAIDAVKQWQYAPLRLNGTPTPFVLTVTLQFHLDNHDT